MKIYSEVIFKQIEDLINELDNLNANSDKYNLLKRKLNLFEYVYELGLPIVEEELLDEIVKKCNLSDVNPTRILNIIMEENIHLYTKKPEPIKKEEYLTREKMQNFGIDDENIEMILEVKEIIGQKLTKNSEVDGIIEYLLLIEDEEKLEEYLEEYFFTYNENIILGVMKKVLDKINNNKDIDRMLNLIGAIYFKYKEKTRNIDDEIKVENPKILFLLKPTSGELYIYDDIDKIELQILRDRIKLQFQELIDGYLGGKPIIHMPVKKLLEKKSFKVRTTYKILPNNYVVIINCYMKGNNESTKTKIRLNNNVQFQIKLYEALCSGNQEIINKTITYVANQMNIPMCEVQLYIDNFKNAQEINILEYFQRGGVSK